MVSISRTQPSTAAVAPPPAVEEKPAQTAAVNAISAVSSPQAMQDGFDGQASADQAQMGTDQNKSSITSAPSGMDSSSIASSPPVVDLANADLNDPKTIEDLSKIFGVEQVQLQKRVSDSEFDGALVGADKTIKMEDLGGTKDMGPIKLDDIEGFTPKAGRLRSNETIIQVNGINTTLSQQKQALQATADATGAKVVGIHNATDGFVGDLLQSVGDKTNMGKNLAVDSLRDAILGELKAGKNVHVMAHSQGGLITSRALGQVSDELKKQGKSDQMGNIAVETFGAASGRYPDGPRYVHYVNNKDPVSNMFGVEGATSFRNHPGKDIEGRPARIVQFSEKSLIAAHNYNDVYMSHRKDFGLMYNGPGLVVQDPNRYQNPFKQD
jgi:hypothetical protein